MLHVGDVMHHSDGEEGKKELVPGHTHCLFIFYTCGSRRLCEMSIRRRLLASVVMRGCELDADDVAAVMQL